MKKMTRSNLYKFYILNVEILLFKKGEGRKHGTLRPGFSALISSCSLSEWADDEK